MQNRSLNRCLFIPLVEAERCWSYAMQLKSEMNENPRKRYHMVNKLRKAENFAQELATLCDQISVDARTKLEVQVSDHPRNRAPHYTTILSG